MRLLLGFFLLLIVVTTSSVRAEPKSAVEQAAFAQELSEHTRQLETIRKIVLNQGDDARALANLVQLTRNLPPAATAQLFFDLSTDYLTRAKYNQAANVLQQLLNQHANQPVAREAMLRLVRLYSSSEAQYTQASKSPDHNHQAASAGFAQYALHVANTTIQQLPDAAKAEVARDPTVTFQQSVATRLYGQQKAALGLLTRLKRNPQAEPWRTRALSEQWLYTDRSDESPLPTISCRRAESRPHLDGVLEEPIWQSGEPIRLSYDEKFLYLAVNYPKNADVDYASDASPRSYDADLSNRDRVRIRLDVDRDYATAYDLTIDHRGWTNDSCWLHTDWNPKWFVAANSTDTHWSIEAAMPLDALVSSSPQVGESWAIAIEHLVPNAQAATKEPRNEIFRLMLFE